MTEAAPDLRVVAIHEAAHAVVGLAVGWEVEYAHVGRNGGTWGHVSFVEPPEGLWEGHNPERLPGQQPAELRAEVERSVVINLAGTFAEVALAGPPTAGYRPEPTSGPVVDLLALPPRVTELLAEREQREHDGGTDETRALALANRFVGRNAGWLYLEWLRAEAEYVVTHWAPSILRVAHALEEHGHLSGEQIAAIVAQQGETEHA